MFHLDDTSAPSLYGTARTVFNITAPQASFLNYDLLSPRYFVEYIQLHSVSCQWVRFSHKYVYNESYFHIHLCIKITVPYFI